MSFHINKKFARFSFEENNCLQQGIQSKNSKQDGTLKAVLLKHQGNMLQTSQPNKEIFKYRHQKKTHFEHTQLQKLLPNLSNRI